MTEDSRLAANRRARQEKKQAWLRALYERHAERFRAAASGDAPGLAREAHAAMDEMLERDRGSDAQSAGIQCRKGCSHCCHGPVEIWPQEAELLAGAARAAGLELDEGRLERQGRYTEDTWREQPAADRACVFLGEDGACRVYESRPNACRKLLVLSDPALCEAEKHPLASVERWFSWEAEAMESAALEVLGRELMPRALLAALRNRQD
jgi:Fe-S-cluster containining protein